MILGLFWIMILGIAYRRHVSKLLTLGGMQSVAVTALLIGCVWYIGAHQEQELKRYTPRHPQHFIEADSWWQRDWRLLPAFRIDLSGASSHPLTLQWTGGLEVFRKYLQGQGWHEPVPLTPVSSLQWLRINPPLKELPLLPQAHDGRHESLVLVHATGNPEQELVLRLWSGDYRLQETRNRVWTGYVAYQKTEMPLPMLTIPLTVRDFDGPLQEFKSYLRGLRWRSVLRSPEAENETAGSMRWNSEVLLMRPKGKSGQAGP
jgi:undecaprenyl-diphosphatase